MRQWALTNSKDYVWAQLYAQKNLKSVFSSAGRPLELAPRFQRIADAILTDNRRLLGGCHHNSAHVPCLRNTYSSALWSLARRVHELSGICRNWMLHSGRVRRCAWTEQGRATSLSQIPTFRPGSFVSLKTGDAVTGTEPRTPRASTLRAGPRGPAGRERPSGAERPGRSNHEGRDGSQGWRPRHEPLRAVRPHSRIFG